MMAYQYLALYGLLRAAKGLPNPRLPPSLLLSRPSPRRSKQDEDDAHLHRPGH